MRHSPIAFTFSSSPLNSTSAPTIGVAAAVADVMAERFVSDIMRVTPVALLRSFTASLYVRTRPSCFTRAVGICMRLFAAWSPPNSDVYHTPVLSAPVPSSSEPSYVYAHAAPTSSGL